jgi:hypothetical protein
LVLIAGLLLPAAARAVPAVQPWTPAGADSISTWAVRARAGFRANTGDSLGGDNFRAYELVGRIGRQLLRSLGRGNFAQAPAIEGVIDSLGLDTDVAVDPTSPYFALMMVHNPFRPSADVSGFLYWFLGNDLRYQGVRFTSGRNLVTRIWRTAYDDKPYSWGIIENARNGPGRLKFTLLRLAQTGYFWTADQFPSRGGDFGERGDATFADLNNDGVPEVVSWSVADPDSLFNECMGCPKLLTERTWNERYEGFELTESRLVPSTYATWVLFIRLMRAGNNTAAARLLADPAKITEAVANHWSQGSARGLWQTLNVEPGQTWPHWIAVRRGRGREAQSWVVHFVVKDGRWLIRDWLKEQPAPVKVQAR